MKVNKCWANSLDNCEGKLTAEHIISKAILSKDSPIEFTYSTGEVKNLYENSFKIKRLCQKHNNALSDYDIEISILAKCLDKRGSKIFIENYGGSINILKVEKWFAKTSVNHYLLNKNLNYQLDVDLIAKIVYSDLNFQYPYGLWYCDFLPITKKPLIDKDFYFTPFFDRKEFKGFGYILFGHRFIFVPPNCKFEVYRKTKYIDAFDEASDLKFYADFGLYRFFGNRIDLNPNIKFELWENSKLPTAINQIY